MNAKMEAPDLYLGEQSFEGGAKTKSIGELIQDARNLSADDLDRIGRYQRENDMARPRGRRCDGPARPHPC